MNLHTNENAAQVAAIVNELVKYFEGAEGAKIENIQACRVGLPGRPDWDHIRIAINPFDTMCLGAAVYRHRVPLDELPKFFTRYFKTHPNSLRESPDFITSNQLMVVSQNQTEAIVREIQMSEARSNSIEPDGVEMERSELTGALNNALNDIAAHVLAGSSMRGDFWIESLDNGKVKFHIDYAASPRTKEELEAALAALASDRANRAKS